MIKIAASLIALIIYFIPSAIAFGVGYWLLKLSNIETAFLVTLVLVVNIIFNLFLSIRRLSSALEDEQDKLDGVTQGLIDALGTMNQSISKELHQFALILAEMKYGPENEEDD